MNLLSRYVPLNHKLSLIGLNETLNYQWVRICSVKTKVETSF